MQNKKILSVFLLAFMLVLTNGCSKTGPAGPQGGQGAQGPQGKQGPEGPVGPAGADGSTIFSGNGSPGAGIGKKGDFYLNKENGDLYGPKTDDGWGDPLNLTGAQGAPGQKGDTGDTGPQGPQGEKGDTGAQGPKGQDGKDGKNGSQILSGSAAPAATVGEAGDYYLDTATYVLYGPKAAGGWGSGISLKGPKGDTGDPGNANVIASPWFSVSAASWTESSRMAGATFGEPSDVDIAVNTGSPYHISETEASGAILVYLDNGEGIRPIPSFQETVTSFGTIGPVGVKFSGTVGFRYVVARSIMVGNPNWYLYLVVALKKGNWDWGATVSDTKYIQKTFLPSLKWRVVAIPPYARKASPPPDPADYEATCAYYGIPD